MIGLTTDTALAALVNSQNTSAAVSMAQTEDFTLYISEPGGIARPECGAGDSDAAEIIFEGDENAAPGSTRTWDIRLRDVGTAVPWDLSSFDITVTPVDSGEDCQVPPVLYSEGARLLGKIDANGQFTDPMTQIVCDPNNDNHCSGSGPDIPGAIGLYRENVYLPGCATQVVHVAPGHYEQH